MIKKCLICGKGFKTFPSRIKEGVGKYCSSSCAMKDRKYIKKGEIIKCKTCGDEIYVPPHRKNKTKYCSIKCASKSGGRREISIKNLPKNKNKTLEEMYGLEKAKEIKKKISDKTIGKISFLKGKSYEEFYGKEDAKGIQEKLSISSIKKWEDPLYKDKAVKAILNGLMKRPTSYEKKISDLCIENSLPFIYTGNGAFLINFKNPDFVNEKDKVVIEVFYSWFKIRDYGSVENYKEFCRKKYNHAGWKVIFIDETEVDVDNWKELCLNKIKEKLIEI